MDIFNGNMMKRWNRAFSINLGISSILVLAQLRKFGPLRGVELSKKLELTPGAITNITNKLFEKNLITRTIDPNSRRSIYYAIEPEGLNILNEAKEKGEKIQIEMLQVLTNEEQRQLLALYKKINESY